MPLRPRIGITTSLNDGEQRLDRRYVQAVEHVGGLPVIVPMLDSESAADAFSAMLDGLVVTGGPAITDGLIGALPDEIDETELVRLASDKRLLSSFLDARQPVLGICYGMQLASALGGGSIYADVERQAPDSGVHSSKRGGTEHDVFLTPGSHLARLLGRGSLTVNTRHLQAIESPGRGLRVAARAPDGVIEAVEREDGSFIGVQWHPERMGASMAPLFAHLVELARQTDRALETA